MEIICNPAHGREHLFLVHKHLQSFQCTPDIVQTWQGRSQITISCNSYNNPLKQDLFKSLLQLRKWRHTKAKQLARSLISTNGWARIHINVKVQDLKCYAFLSVKEAITEYEPLSLPCFDYGRSVTTEPDQGFQLPQTHIQGFSWFVVLFCLALN